MKRYILAAALGVTVALIYFRVTQNLPVQIIGNVTEQGNYYTIWGSGVGSSDGLLVRADTAGVDSFLIVNAVRANIYLSDDLPFEMPVYLLKVGGDTVLIDTVRTFDWQWQTFIVPNKDVEFRFINDQWVKDSLDVNLDVVLKVYPAKNPVSLSANIGSDKIRILWDRVEPKATYNVRLWNDFFDTTLTAIDTFLFIPDSILTVMPFFFTSVRAVDSVGNISVPSETLAIFISQLEANPCDLNEDGKVDSLDLVYFKSGFGYFEQDSLYISKFDLNKDGVVDGIDLFLLRNQCGEVFK